MNWNLSRRGQQVFSDIGEYPVRSDIAARKKAIIGKNRYLLQEYGDDQSGQNQNAPDPFAAFGGKKR